MTEKSGVGHTVSPPRWTVMRARYGWKVWSGPPTEGEAYGAQEDVEVMPVAEHEALREAAMAVVLTWDVEGTQHNTMPALREALGFPREPPTREEGQARLSAHYGIPDA